MTSRYTWMLPAGCRYTPKSKLQDLPTEAVEAPIIKLRRGGSVQPIVQWFSSVKLLQVTGPPGCGKSTKVPEALSKALNTVILHLVPHPMQAVQTVAALDSGLVLKDMNLLFDSRSKTGVMVMTYTTLVSFIIRSDKSFDQLDPRVLLYCDESHESDSATYSFIRYVSSGLSKCRAALVSATLDGQEFAVEEGFGTITEISSETADCVSLARLVGKLSKGKPRYKVLYFSDSQDERRKCVALFRECGFASFELDSRSQPNLFEGVFSSNKEDHSWFCAVDSTYRTGFNFDLDCVLDSCSINYKSVLDGKERTRSAFNFECYQAKGRLGRTAYTDSSVYVRFGRKTDDLIARVEGLEMANACMILRTQGLHDSRLTVESLDDVRYILKDLSLIDGRRPMVVLPDSEFYTEEDTARRVRNRVQRVATSSRTYGDDYCGLIDSLILDAPRVVVDEKVGKYYCVVGNMQIEDKSPVFPGGRDNVMNYVESGRLERVMHTLPSMDAEFSTKVLTTELCNLSLKHHGSMQFLTEVSQSTKTLNAGQCAYFRSLRDDLAMSSNKFTYYAKLVNKLLDTTHVEITEIDANEFLHLEEAVKQKLSEDVSALENRITSPPDLSVGRIHGSMHTTAGLPMAQQSRLVTSSNSPRRKTSDPGSSKSGSSTSSSFWRLGVKQYDANLGKLIDPYKVSSKKPD